MLTFQAESAFEFDYSYTPGEAPTYDYPGSNPEIEITKVRLNGIEIPIKAITGEMYENMIEYAHENHD